MSAPCVCVCVFGDLLINLCLCRLCWGEENMQRIPPSCHSVGEEAQAYCFSSIFRLNFRTGFYLVFGAFR